MEREGRTKDSKVEEIDVKPEVVRPCAEYRFVLC